VNVKLYLQKDRTSDLRHSSIGQILFEDLLNSGGPERIGKAAEGVDEESIGLTGRLDFIADFCINILECGKYGPKLKVFYQKYAMRSAVPMPRASYNCRASSRKPPNERKTGRIM